jgi:potassium-dependent mechanosensitive channel
VIQTQTLGALQEVFDATEAMAGKLDQQIKSRIKQELFSRKIISRKAFDTAVLRSELTTMKIGVGRLLHGKFWMDEGFRMKASGTLPLLTLGVLVIFGTFCVVSFRRLCDKWERLLPGTDYPWRRFTLDLIRRSAFLLGTAGILLGYDIIQFPHFKLPVVRLLLNLVWVWLFSRWIMDFLRFWEPAENQPFAMVLKPALRMLIVFLRFFAIVYLFAVWLVGDGTLILFALRLTLEIVLIILCFRFWKTCRGKEHSCDLPTFFHRFMQSFMMGMSYLIVFGGLVVELAGYPTLAIYWCVSWAKTGLVAFCMGFLFMVIGEWQQTYRTTQQTADMGSPGEGGPPMQLFFIQGAWLIWVMCLLNGLVLAWSTNWEVFQAAYGFISRPWTMGKINLSILGLVYAMIILFFTYTLTRMGRYFLTEKIFHESTMESGLKMSISSITVYLMWGVGIILVLGVLGVDTTSLAVIFGALSIGIGFGLQNIFNNFISGIILLFERPIQVGDAVEIAGIWGTVKKINVRATVVQTYDNASLIIPNSEFISSQVTNWSFKDHSMRRKINVGVAYGSDIELVRKTLLEIARRTPNVKKQPAPDVHFMDHGDSALIFTLRYWTTLDYYYTTSTDIRFELDRLFREHGIEIAFPQRDIHIRSIAKESPMENTASIRDGKNDSN